jgi:Tol biopolymer transport system component
VYRVGPDFNRIQLHHLELAFSPDGRYLAFALGQVEILDTRTARVRPTRASGRDIAWAPDGSRLLFLPVGLSDNGDSASTGDLRTVTPGGRIRTVLAASVPYAGQIVSAAWTAPAPGVR